MPYVEQANHIHPGDAITYRDDLHPTRVLHVDRDPGPQGTDRHDTGTVTITTDDGQTRTYPWTRGIYLLSPATAAPAYPRSTR